MIHPATMFRLGRRLQAHAPTLVSVGVSLGAFAASALFHLGDALCRRADNRAERQYRHDHPYVMRRTSR